MLLKWVGVVMPGENAQLSVLHRGTTVDEEVVMGSKLVEVYPF